MHHNFNYMEIDVNYKRYMLFYYHDYEASGGINDCRFSSDTFNKCIEELQKEYHNNKSVAEWFRNFHIFDRVEGKVHKQQLIYERHFVKQ